MIRWLVRWLWGDEIERQKAEMLSEAKDLISDAKTASRAKYVRYDPIPLDSEGFLHGIQPLFKNRFFVAWVESQRDKRNRLIADCMSQRDDTGALRALAQINMLDLLLADLRLFQEKYEEMLEAKREE
jgi:hypothetical protein